MWAHDNNNVHPAAGGTHLLVACGVASRLLTALLLVHSCGRRLVRCLVRRRSRLLLRVLRLLLHVALLRLPVRLVISATLRLLHISLLLLRLHIALLLLRLLLPILLILRGLLCVAAAATVATAVCACSRDSG